MISEIFRYLTPFIYWLLIIFWLFIFLFYARRANKKKYDDILLRTLFIILSIDSFRTLFESTYFGFWYTSLSGLIPIEIFNFLAQPQIVFFPKIINLIVSIIIIFILIRKWIPREDQRLEGMKSELLTLESAFNQSPVSIIITDINGKIEYVNKKICELTGYSESELKGQNPNILSSGFTDRELYTDLWDKINNGFAWRGLFHNKKKNGEFYWEDSLISPIYNDQGVITRFLATKEDITEKIVLERERELLLMAISHISDMIVILDKDWKIEYVNLAYEMTTGYSKDESIGKRVDHLKSIQNNEDDFNHIREIVARDNCWKGTFENKKKDGTLFTDFTEITQLYDDTGKIVNYVEVKRDITEDLKIQEHLQHREKMDTVGQLAGGIAHDFNNVLSGIMSAAQLLKLPKRDLDEKSLKYVDIILDASIRASKLSSRLLLFSNKSNQTFAPINIHNIVQDVCDILRNTLDKKVQLELIPNEEELIIMGNNSEIHNAILNLCINSSHALPSGGSIIIDMGIRELDHNFAKNSIIKIIPGRYCWIEIKDDGVGIAQENLDKIFEPFFTTKEVGVGTGLGLSAVYKMVERHKGTIEVESKWEEGSTFRIYFPFSSEKPEKSSKKSNVDFHKSTVSGKIVLIVDDEKNNQIVIGDIIKSIGFDILVASNGLEALKLFKENEIFLVVLDMIMPEMNGYETFLEMRKLNENCKIIISTGYSDSKEMIELRRLGLTGELHKPYKIEELSQIIDREI